MWYVRRLIAAIIYFFILSVIKYVCKAIHCECWCGVGFNWVDVYIIEWWVYWQVGWCFRSCSVICLDNTCIRWIVWDALWSSAVSGSPHDCLVLCSCQQPCWCSSVFQKHSQYTTITLLAHASTLQRDYYQCHWHWCFWAWGKLCSIPSENQSSGDHKSSNDHQHNHPFWDSQFGQ